MSPRRSATILVLAAVVGYAATRAATASNISDQVPATCPITKPSSPPYTPPPAYGPSLGNDRFWFGSEKLWITLPTNGMWMLRRYAPMESALRQKLLWYRKGYNAKTEPNPRLIVTGKRLDLSDPPLGVDGPQGGTWISGDPTHSFMSVGLDIPTGGCWEISGHFGEDALTFVVWVRDISVFPASGSQAP